MSVCPRYCLMGDAMNTSSRMMSFGDEQCIHISGGVKAELPATYACKVNAVYETWSRSLTYDSGPWQDHCQGKG